MKLGYRDLKILYTALRWLEWPDDAKSLGLGFTVKSVESLQARIGAELDRIEDAKKKKALAQPPPKPPNTPGSKQQPKPKGAPPKND